ncbi:FecR family protein [Mucilaginibacter gracilis]|uniref:FecR family protein n=1 Tax=Mucilaginibacter gracilis TaxID=423350 RepID=A0A495IUI4_9SPHI|nr:FecR family protein [Mucilaginibacter gracilis]RKR79961.1 FecR family protein [Mucilaginibacter gracilis]
MEASIKQLFVNFISNQCTNDEKVQVLAYINAGGYEDEWEAAIKETGHLNQNQSTTKHTFDEATLYKKIKFQAGIVKKTNKPLKWMAVAATSLLICAIGFYLLKPAVKSTPPLLVKTSAAKPLQQSSRKWIKLPDGTSVQLNNNSHLDYPDSFTGKANREVTLTGEAYFDVKHIAAHPFIIHTGKIRTTVLGTAFNISAYKANAKVTVTVTRGRVMVQDANKTLAILKPNQQLLWTPDLKAPSKQQIDASTVTVWKANDLIMDDITLAEAADMVSKRYGVKVLFKNDKVKTCRFTAAFLNRNEIGQVLSVLSDITGAKLELKNGIIAIDGPGC